MENKVTYSNLETARYLIKTNNMEWSAGYTSISDMNKVDKKNIYNVPNFKIPDGLIIRDSEKTYYELAAKEAEEDFVRIYPEIWDWRDVRARDWTTPIKNQHDAMLCWAYAFMAMIESTLRINARRYYKTQDLEISEQYIVRLMGEEKNDFDNNFLSSVMDAINTNEISLPAANNWSDLRMLERLEILKKNIIDGKDVWSLNIGKCRMTKSYQEAKEWISHYGPVVTTIGITSEFCDYYREGIYDCLNDDGSNRGDHAICIIGYNDLRGYWICKNSYGKGWGEDGWCKIRYKAMDIGNRPFYGLKPPEKIGMV